MKIEDALLLADPDKVTEEIHDREQLVRQMVGSLYPRIVEGRS